MAREKQLAKDSASMARVLDMAVVLACGVTTSITTLKKAKKEKKADEDKVWKLEVALRVY